MDIAIVPVIEQMLMSGKTVLSGMFNDQDTGGLQYVLPEYQPRYFFNTRRVVWRIGKNNIILCFANGQEMENIITDDANLSKTQPPGCSSDKICMSGVYFHRMNDPASS